MSNYINMDDFCIYLENEVNNHSIYVWAAQGEGYNVISDDWIRHMETSESNAEKAIKFWHEQVKAGYEKKLHAFDCSGLGMNYICEHTSYLDMTADTMYNELCTPIEKSQLRKGDWVFKKNAAGKKTHVGYIVDDALHVVEAKGRSYGVTRSALSNGSWNAFGRPKIYDSKIVVVEPEWIVTRQLKKFCKGEDVKELQRRLINKGISCGPSGVDGSFGGDTRKAVIAYQKTVWPNTESEWDGIAGRKTLTALGAKCMW